MRKNIPIETDVDKLKQSIQSFNQVVTLEQLALLTHGQYAHNSLLSMCNDWNRFVLFCQNKHVSPLPASVTAIRLFLESESKHRKFASLRRYRLTIGAIHRFHDLSDPSNHRQIHFTLSALQNIKKDDHQQASAFTSEHLAKLHQLLEPDENPKDLRDLLIYHLMFECLLKRGQLRELQLDNIHRDGESVKVSLLDSQYPLSSQATQLLEQWISLKGTQSSILLCSIDRHNNLGSEPLNDSSIYRIFRRASTLLGLPKHLSFSGQSARVGATQDLYKKGYQLRDIQQVGRWSSPVMPAQYLGKHQLSEDEKMVFKTIKSWD